MGAPLHTPRALRHVLTLSVTSLTLLLTLLTVALATPAPELITTPTERRFISLAPSLTEWVYELGAQEQLVARSARCDQPAQALDKPSAGGLFPPDLELILSYRPSDVLMIEGHEVLKAQLARLGVRVHTLQPHTVEDLWGVTRTLGALLNRREEAERWVARSQLRLKARLAERPTSASPKVLIEVWPKPLSVAGAESFMGALVKLVGAEPTPSGLGAWPQLPLEQLLLLNPEVIFVSSAQRARELLSPEAPRAWRSLRAIQTGRVFAREGRLERPGPRLLEELSWLIERLDTPAQR